MILILEHGSRRPPPRPDRAAGGVTRAGLERMVVEVCLGKLGAVAAREVSRFARNSRDWQQLIEMHLEARPFAIDCGY